MERQWECQSILWENEYDCERNTNGSDFIKALGEKALLVGFSLGDQIAFEFISEYPILFYSVIIC